MFFLVQALFILKWLKIFFQNEHIQSVVVNVWMVQDWYDEFVDWNPHEYGMINKTIVPYDEIFIPDTYLYNSETLEQKRTEAMMNVILTTGYWRNDSRGAAGKSFLN